MDVEVLVTRGLGDNSYVVVSGDEAAAIDPQRDVGRILDVAARRGARIRRVLETHVHNDYVSGAVELRGATGAEVVAPASAGMAFPHRPVEDGDEVEVGDLRLRAMRTPGHTPEHTSYLLLPSSAEKPAAVFTGGSLMVGSAGRTDLLGDALTEELTRAQYRTLRRLAGLPDAVRVLPTHGAGSFCGAGPGGADRTTTLGEERRRNRALAARDEEEFVQQQLSGLLAYPDYYRHIAPINRAGPRLLAELPRPGPLSPEDVERAMGGGATVVDARRRRAFAQAHVPGSLNVELDPSFASYVGWVVPFGDPLALVLPEPADDALEEAATQLRRIGYERIEGYLDGGVEAWGASGRSIRSYPVVRVEDVCAGLRSGSPLAVLDVRQDAEWERSRIPGSMHIFVGDLADRLPELPNGEVWAMCASGHRSAIAASMLDRAGIPVRLVTGGGVDDVLTTCPEVATASP